MTICDSNGFKNSSVMKSANMSNFRIFSAEEFKYWPKDEAKVEKAYLDITFEAYELIERIKFRYDNGHYIYCKGLKIPENYCDPKLLKILTYFTIFHGRCYTLEFTLDTKFYATDNIIIHFKRDINLFLHGISQGMGLVGNFFPQEPFVYSLKNNQNHRLDFQNVEKVMDEVLICDKQEQEIDYYGCARKYIMDDFEFQSSDCIVPMLINFTSK